MFKTGVYIKDEFAVHEFSERHIGPCSSIYADVFGNPPWNEHWSPGSAGSVIRRAVCKKGFIGFVAEYRGNCAGCLFGYQVCRRVFYLNELFVLPECQGLGMGKALVCVLFDELKRKRISYSVLLTKQGTPAERFYYGVGFRPILPGLSLKKKILMLRDCRKTTVSLICDMEDGINRIKREAAADNGRKS